MIINNKKYNIVIAETEEQKIKGLSKTEKLDKSEGMLFPGVNMITMEETAIPLKLLFLDDDNNVIDIEYGAPHASIIYSNLSAASVLELHEEAPVNIGDRIEEDVMQVLDDEANTQMVLEGGERIISIPETKELANLAKAATTKEDFIQLGKFIINVFDGQDSRPDEYV